MFARKLLLIGLLFIGTTVSAQNWSTLNDQFFALYDKQDYAKAVVIGEKARIAAKQQFGAMHLTYATTLYNLAGAYLELRNYKKAEPLYLEAGNIQLKQSGEMDPDYASTITDLATLYVETGQYAKAEPLYLQAKVISEKTNGKNDPEYITVVENLATLYDQTHAYEKAAPLYLEAHSFYSTHPGEDSIDLLNATRNLAELHDKLGDPAVALPYYEQAARLTLNYYGEQSKEYASAINRTALIYSALGKFEQAGPLYFKVEAIRKKLFGENDPEYASALNNIGTHYADLGQYDLALRYYQDAAVIAEPFIKKGNPDYATYVNNYALLYMQLGQYDIAEPLLVMLVDVKKKLFGEDDPSYATSVNNLASIQFKTGQYQKAAQSFAKALGTIKKILGAQSLEAASTLSNLGLVYATMGQYEKAEPLYLEAMQIREKRSATRNPDYATLLDNLGILYSNTHRAAKTRAYYEAARKIREELVGTQHPDYAVSLNNLGYDYMDAGEYRQAEQYFSEAVSIMKKALGTSNPSYETALLNLVTLYLRTGQFEKAEPLLLEAGKIAQQAMRATFSILSEAEKNNYIVANSLATEAANSFLFRYPKATKEVVISNLDLQLALRSASLTATRQMVQSIENSTDKSVKTLFDAWRANRNFLSRQYALPPSQRSETLPRIEQETERQEKELSQRSAAFREQENAMQVNTTTLQQQLDTDEAAIEFVRFPLNTLGSDSVMYAAYVLRKDKPTPDFVPLCEEKQLQHLFDSAASNRTSMVTNFYRGAGVTATGTAGMAGQLLYRLIWQPLEPYLKSIHKIAYAPAGKLYAVAFHAMPVDSSRVLSDRYRLEQYISTRQLLFRKEETPLKVGAMVTLIGNPSFTRDSISRARSGVGKEISAMNTPTAQPGANGIWQELPGTAEEIRKIRALFEAHHIAPQVLVKATASEENLKKLSGQPVQLIHIATHGFFLPDPSTKSTRSLQDANVYRLANNPLMRSGIVLAGANYAWNGNKPLAGKEDGIVTALELSQLNLEKTELVVLSACETALGDIKGTEGVFGLQRAFKLAGVKKMIVSLWQVPDKETAELMTLFYENCLNGQSLRTAFTQAQAALRQRYPAYYWAAFVLVE